MAAIGGTQATRIRLCPDSASGARDSGLQRVGRGQPQGRSGGGLRSVLPAVGSARQPATLRASDEVLEPLPLIPATSWRIGSGSAIPSQDGSRLVASRTMG